VVTLTASPRLIRMERIFPHSGFRQVEVTVSPGCFFQIAGNHGKPVLAEVLMEGLSTFARTSSARARPVASSKGRTSVSRRRHWLK